LRIREEVEQRWTHYAGGVLAFSFLALLFVYLLQRLQGYLPSTAGLWREVDLAGSGLQHRHQLPH